MINLNNLEVNKEELKESIKYACETIRKNIDNTIEVAFEQAKDLDPDDKIWVLNIIKKYNLLPIGEFISNSPETIHKYLQDSDYPRLFIYYYSDFLEDNNEIEDKKKIVDEIWNYVKEHKIIGCILDW